MRVEYYQQSGKWGLSVDAAPGEKPEYDETFRPLGSSRCHMTFSREAPVELVVPAKTRDDFKTSFGCGVCSEAKGAQSAVLRLVKDLEKPLAAGRLSRLQVADEAMKLADKTKDAWTRFLLLKGAFCLAVRADAKNLALRTWLHLSDAAIPRLDPVVATNVLSEAVRDQPGYGDPRLRAEYEKACTLAPYAEARNRLLTRECRGKGSFALLGDNHAALGDWPAALAAYVRADSPLDKIAKAELSGRRLDGRKIGDVWWQYAERDTLKPLAVRACRAHAAAWYARALAGGKLSEDEALILSRRMANAACGRPSVPVDAREEAEYLVIDLSGGAEARCYPVHPLFERDLPRIREAARSRKADAREVTVNWPDDYKADRLVLRRILPGSFEQGGQRYAVSRPFYMGVFEVTQRQYELVMGTNPAQFRNPLNPVERVSHDAIRGTFRGRGWPMTREVDAASFLGRLRARTGLAFDLPTEIQWEYACRAGKAGEYDGSDNPVEMEQLGRYNDNGGRKRDPAGGTDQNGNPKMIDLGPAVAGSYKPNAWGLYDMHGNVWEWCLDRHDSRNKEPWGWIGSYGEVGDKESQTEPFGSVLGVSRLYRGGSWRNSSADCRASRRHRFGSWDAGYDIGFRLACPQDPSDQSTGRHGKR